MKTIIAILIATATCVAVASAQPGRGQGGPNMHGPQIGNMIEQLDLTAEQKEAVDQAQRAFQKQMVDLRADCRKAREAARDLMSSPSVTREEAMKAVEAEAAAELAARKAAVEHRLAIRDIIGPENAAKLIELREERREDMRERGAYGHGPKHGPGPGRGFDDDRGPPPEE